jgi:hypothetical protein
VSPARAACAAATTVSTGISCWQTSTSPSAITAVSAALSPANELFAPGLTMIEFSPARSTMMTATPDGP